MVTNNTGETINVDGKPMLPVLAPIISGVLGLFGGGKSSAPTGPIQAGDASAGLDAPFQYNGQFTVGGSGTVKADSNATQDNAKSALDSNTLGYIGIGVAVLGVVLTLVLMRKK